MCLSINVYPIGAQGAHVPLKGRISNKPDKPPIIQRQCGKTDPRCPIHKGNVSVTYLRGSIGITYNIRNGRILSLDAKSDLRRAGVHEGDYILGIEKEAYRPCLMPLISFYPKDFILQLTIRQPNGATRKVFAKLLDARKIPDVQVERN